MSVLRSLLSGFLALACASCVAQAGPSSTFTTQQKTAVPGAVLQPGAYTIQIVDHLSDRSVVQITSTDKPSTVTFLGVGTAGSSLASANGPVFWNKGLAGEKALRGFHFSAGERLEFVYSKDDAVALATANKEGVVAVDTASEKRPELSKLSPEDRQLVTLWSLTPVKVGPENASAKGIEAKRYVAQNPQAGQLSASTAAPATSYTAAPQQQTLVAKLDKPRPTAKANQGEPYVKRLPQTASYVPLVGMLAILSLSGALFLRLRSTL